MVNNQVMNSPTDTPAFESRFLSTPTLPIYSSHKKKYIVLRKIKLGRKTFQPGDRVYLTDKEVTGQKASGPNGGGFFLPARRKNEVSHLQPSSPKRSLVQKLKAVTKADKKKRSGHRFLNNKLRKVVQDKKEESAAA